MRFHDRTDAGRQLAERIAARGLADPVVLALPRGGVPVAYEVATRLRAPLEVFVARKIGAPGHEEFGIGAIGERGAVVADEVVLRSLGVSRDRFDRFVAHERGELDRRVRRYRGDRGLPALEGRDVVLVDDGLATGVTAEAALRDLASCRPRRLVLAVPACAPDTAERLLALADDIVCVIAPEPFQAVGLWYERFDQTTDDEVVSLLARAAEHAAPAPPVEQAVVVPQDGDVAVDGDLTVPDVAVGAVVFAHGSGSSRRSSRNRLVAGRLQEHGLATLLLDLLTEDEEAADAGTGHLRFDIGLLARRVGCAVEWVRENPGTKGLPIGCFGASTGAAAALVAAARMPDDVAAVVSRGGRPDLAGDHLPAVRAPTLLIVGGADTEVLRLNRAAAARLTAAEHRIEVVGGATHLFEEPGALDRVAALAAAWFTTHLPKDGAPNRSG